MVNFIAQMEIEQTQAIHQSCLKTKVFIKQHKCVAYFFYKKTHTTTKLLWLQYITIQYANYICNIIICPDY